MWQWIKNSQQAKENANENQEFLRRKAQNNPWERKTGVKPHKLKKKSVSKRN